MSIYFILDSRSSEIKIGRSADIPLRVRALQTGNPGALKLMGWIVATDDVYAQNVISIPDTTIDEESESGSLLVRERYL
jgi:hypothetical protein